ncbi:hypothetical protein L0669_05840 [Flavobacterium bizetiae]|uniref:hypothetical protein n=1 Tax=Flavobacterium bizetiae TaxID=2704140 RepID=UPI0021E90226|nr:hypothetical protein [Flavobacterium bizetiae]UTN05430.1 hypothetical protein L0669_05840 [Flavobacterium bizetiae]
MKENDKEIENLIEKMMSENTLESPSFDFTSKIMSQVLVAEQSKIKAYKPLISKSAWIFIGISLAALTAYTIYFNNDIYNFEIAKTYSDKASALFSGIHFSTNVLYALLVVPFMVLIQIGVLKNYFDKKYEL